jgi:hypothetical protein
MELTQPGIEGTHAAAVVSDKDPAVPATSAVITGGLCGKMLLLT